VTTVAGSPLADVQSSVEARGIELDDVGISGLRYPVCVEMADGSRQNTVCDARLSVALAADVRGTHMSRFVELLDQAAVISPSAMIGIVGELASLLEAAVASVDVTFPLFIRRAAPVTGRSALLAIDCRLCASHGASGASLRIGARMPVTSLCPCSKEISDYSAHSQRGYVAVTALDASWRLGEDGLWPDELLEVCDEAASAPIYPILKRPDERHVTMLAYDRPAFVEDLARDVAVALRDEQRIDGFEVEVVNQESIHDHQAFARVRWDRP
jgi:GTP cyclohydrolase IB